MLPEIDEENFTKVLNDVLSDLPSWRKSMIHYIKEQNPELNSAIIELANKSELDPKALATGAYVTYLLIENAAKKQDELFAADE